MSNSSADLSDCAVYIAVMITSRHTARAVAATVLVASLALGLAGSTAAADSVPVQNDEFVGPFASWTDIKATYGATGNGVTDDTGAIQRGLDQLGTPGHSPVLFIPKGAYRITRTLVLSYNINVSIVGEDPATTTLVWDGTAGGTMLLINGVAYSRFNRLAFDGKRRASVAVEQSWDNLKPNFDTGNEYADDFFTDVEYGIRGGFKGSGFAETSVRRARFTRNTQAGIALGNFNALDAWIWNSTFVDCANGITNTTGAGNFHVYNSSFRRSTVADLSMGNTGGFSARGNYSFGSKAFFIGGGTNNPATISLQGNTIIDPLDSTAIRLGSQGPGLVVDNMIRSLSGAIGPVISWRSFIDADMTTVGNTFTVANPVTTNGRLVSVDDRVVGRTTFSPIEPVPPPPAPNLRRQIFEVPPGSDAAGVQEVIIAAARRAGTRPVVHVPDGTYAIDQTVTLPAGDIQLVGDGYGTILRWTGAGAGPVLKLMGPSVATLRELQIDGAGRADGIVVEKADQVGARVYMDQAQLRSGKETNLFVNGLDNANIQLEDLGFAYSPDAVSIKVFGGQAAAAGGVTAGKTNVFSGASSGNRISIEVSDGARLLVRDLWYEGGAGPGFASIHGRATFTNDGGRVSSPVNQNPPAFNITNLNGRVAILTTDLDDRISISGDGSQSMVIGLGVFDEQKSSDYFADATSPRGNSALINSRQVSVLPFTRSAATPDVGRADAQFIRTMLNHTRAELPQPLSALAAGLTDVRLFRVWVANGLNSIVVSPGTFTSDPPGPSTPRNPPR